MRRRLPGTPGPSGLLGLSGIFRGVAPGLGLGLAGLLGLSLTPAWAQHPAGQAAALAPGGVPGPAATFVFKEVDGVELRADVYGELSEGPRPAVLWLHGGALVMGSREDPDPRVLVPLMDADAEDPEWFHPFMPLLHVTSEHPPTLLIHGTADTDVPFRQSMLMAEAFRREGVPHALLALEGSEHVLRDGDQEAVARAYAAVVPFLRTHLQVDPQAPNERPR